MNAKLLNKGKITDSLLNLGEKCLYSKLLWTMALIPSI